MAKNFNSSALPEHCYAVLPGSGQLIEVRRGEKGYYPCAYSTSDREYNKVLANYFNAHEGISKAQAAAMLAGSMFGWNVPAADPACYDAEGIPIQPGEKKAPTRSPEYQYEQAKLIRQKEHLSAITDEMIDEFEKYMEQLHPQEYRRLREAFGRITDDELGTSPLDSVVGAMKIAPFLSRLFALKEKMPKKGRLYYKLLPEDVKVEVDAFVAFLKENNEYIRNLVQDYVESKTRLAMLYDTDPTHIKEQQEKAVAEADKLIANKILDMIRTMLCKDREVQSFEYTEARKAYFTEQMICEILIALEQAAMSFDMEYDDRQKAMSTELSKAARKEWYLRHKDKGVEP